MKQASERTPIKREMKKLKNEMVRNAMKDEDKNGKEWIKSNMPVEIKQISEYLLSDTIVRAASDD
jgi:hypothetical protein